MRAWVDMKQGEELTYSDMLRTFMYGVHKDFQLRELQEWFVHREEHPALSTFAGWSRRSTSMNSMLISSGGPLGGDIPVQVRISPLSAPTPFSATYLGKLPRKLRTQIHHEPEATPRIHMRQELVTQDVHAQTGYRFRPLKLSSTHVHLPASYPAVSQVCRFMYLKARPILYGRQLYYTDNTKEFQQLVRLRVRTFLQRAVDLNVATSLCVSSLTLQQPQELLKFLSHPWPQGNSSSNSDKETLSLSHTYTKLYLRAATLVLALPLAYIIRSEQFEGTPPQLLTMFHAILLFFLGVAVLPEEGE